MKLLDKIKYHGDTYIIQEIVKREEIGCFTTLDISAHLCEDNIVSTNQLIVGNDKFPVTLYKNEQN